MEIIDLQIVTLENVKSINLAKLNEEIYKLEPCSSTNKYKNGKIKSNINRYKISRKQKPLSFIESIFVKPVDNKICEIEDCGYGTVYLFYYDNNKNEVEKIIKKVITFK